MPQWPILVPGLAAFVNTYGGAVLAGAETGEGWLYVPILGPLVLAGNTGSGGAQAVFALTSIFQAAGLACIIIGLAINRHAAPDEPQARIAPVVVPGGGGLSVAGRF